MTEAAELSRTIERIYEAALDPGAWPHALEDIAAFVDGFSAALFSKDASLTDGEIYHHDGKIDLAFRETYFSKYIRFDPGNTLQYFSDIEKPVSVSSLIPADEFVDSWFYQEWAGPQGLVDFVTVALEKSPVSAAMLGVFRHEQHGIADQRMIDRMGLIAPHVRRAVLIGRAFEQKSTDTAAFSETLDGLIGALFLIDRSGRIVHANAAADRILGRDAVLQAANGRLILADRTADASLKSVLARVASDESGLASQDFIIPIECHAGDRFLAHVLPLGARHGKTRTPYAAIAAIYVQRAGLEFTSTPSVIAKTYALTPTELRVFLAIVDIGGVPETANSLGIAETTVKTHLRHIFAKTGTARQADLVKLMAGYVTPLMAAPMPVAN